MTRGLLAKDIAGVPTVRIPSNHHCVTVQHCGIVHKPISVCFVDGEYDLKTHDCCEGHLKERKGASWRCCGKELIDYAMNKCCAGKKFDKRTQHCCGGRSTLLILKQMRFMLQFSYLNILFCSIIFREGHRNWGQMLCRTSIR